MRDYILLYVNGKRYTLTGEDAFMSLSDFLRYRLQLTGTKVVCAEGDCGACTILQGSIHESTPPGLNYKAINSCITFLNILDCSHIVTVEGLQTESDLHPIQAAMVEHHGAQCGYCTPGFVCAMTALFETGKPVTSKKLMNGLTGNLCRCTGYTSILNAGLGVKPEHVLPLQKRYHDPDMMADLQSHRSMPIQIKTPEKLFYAPTTLADAITHHQSNPHNRLMSSATDLGVQINKDRFEPKTLMNLNLIPELHTIEQQGNTIVVGARATLTQLEVFAETRIPEFGRMLRIFASPQIKNTGTLVGNIANASPIADTLPFLFVSEAELELLGPQGVRVVNINQFYTGYKQLDLKAGELISRVRIPIPPQTDILKLYKVSTRKDLDISLLTCAIRLQLDGPTIVGSQIAMGGVGPVVMRVPHTEQSLMGQPFTLDTFRRAGAMVKTEITPISDVRGSQEYRYQVAENLFLKFFHEVNSEQLVLV